MAVKLWWKWNEDIWNKKGRNPQNTNPSLFIFYEAMKPKKKRKKEGQGNTR